MFRFANNKFSIVLPAIVLAFFVFSVPLIMQASGVTDAVGGLDNTARVGYGIGGTGDISETDGIMVSLPGAIGKIVGAALSFIGVIFFILMIYGGLLWMTAAGNDQQVEKAKDLIVAAIIGLVIVFAAYAITSFIGTSLTK